MNFVYTSIVIAVIALLYAFFTAKKLKKQDSGTDKMKAIAKAIQEGSKTRRTQTLP